MLSRCCMLVVPRASTACVAPLSLSVGVCTRATAPWTVSPVRGLADVPNFYPAQVRPPEIELPTTSTAEPINPLLTHDKANALYDEFASQYPNATVEDLHRVGQKIATRTPEERAELAKQITASHPILVKMREIVAASNDPDVMWKYQLAVANDTVVDMLDLLPTMIGVQRVHPGLFKEKPTTIEDIERQRTPIKQRTVTMEEDLQIEEAWTQVPQLDPSDPPGTFRTFTPQLNQPKLNHEAEMEQIAKDFAAAKELVEVMDKVPEWEIHESEERWVDRANHVHERFDLLLSKLQNLSDDLEYVPEEDAVLVEDFVDGILKEAQLCIRKNIHHLNMANKGISYYVKDQMPSTED